MIDIIICRRKIPSKRTPTLYTLKSQINSKWKSKNKINKTNQKLKLTENKIENKKKWEIQTSQFPSNGAKNVMGKTLPCKFYYSQAHESLCKEWLVHLWGWSHKELDRDLNFSKE